MFTANGHNGCTLAIDWSAQNSRFSGAKIHNKRIKSGGSEKSAITTVWPAIIAIIIDESNIRSAEAWPVAIFRELLVNKARAIAIISIYGLVVCTYMHCRDFINWIWLFIKLIVRCCTITCLFNTRKISKIRYLYCTMHNFVFNSDMKTWLEFIYLFTAKSFNLIQLRKYNRPYMYKEC